MSLFKKEDYVKHDVIEKKLVFKKTYLEDRGDSDKRWFIFTEPGKRKEIRIHADTMLIQSGPRFKGNGVFTIGYDRCGTPYYIIKGKDVWFRYRGNRIISEYGNAVDKKPIVKSTVKMLKPLPTVAEIRQMPKSAKTHKKIMALIKARDNANPMAVTDWPWLMAVSKKKNNQPHTKNGGKWLVFAKPEIINTIWQKIKKATVSGKLGPASKVSTAKPNPHANDSNKVICIYTYDYTDVKDVMRVRKELTKLGITNKIPYKTDQAARDGKYRVNGNTRISTYYC